LEHWRTLIVIPAYHEEGKVRQVVRKIPPGLGDPLVVDDCSQDNTAGEASAAGAKVIRHKKNVGVGGAIRSGIEYALAHGYDIVAVLSGDDQLFGNGHAAYHIVQVLSSHD